MNKDFIQYVYTRIEKALTENEEYVKLQSDCAKAGECKDLDSYIEISSELEAKAEELCYIKGFNDAMKLMINSTGNEAQIHE